MSTYKYFMSAALLLVSMMMSAQQSRISGKVVDDEGQPLPGASVLVKGTKTGANADADGNYSLTADASATLEFSFIGYETKTVQVNSRSIINVILPAEASFLNETVVIGYGVQKKVNLTGSVATTDFEQIAKSRPITTPAAALSGMNAGVMVRQSSSTPGSEGVSIRVRGIGTLNDSAPLVIVDGFEGSLGNVNPDDIATISVLKDAASCAIYGNRGANGVVLITTKNGGRQGKASSSITYSGQFAINTPANKFRVVSDYADYMEIMNESAENIGNSPIFSQAMIDLWREKSKDPNGIADSGYPNYVAYPNTDWVDAMFNRNVYQKHNISASGSSGNGTNYLISASYLDNPGIVDNMGYKRFQLRTNVSSWITKWLEAGTRLWGYLGNRQLNDFSGASGFMSRAVPGIYPEYDGKFGWMENPEQSSNSRNNLYFFNRIGGREKTLYLNAALFLNIKLPLDIKYHASFNYTHQTVDYMKWVNLGGAYSFSRGENAYEYNNLANQYTEQNNSNTGHWTFQTDFSYNHTFAKKHEVGAMVGFEALYHNYGNSSGRKSGASTDNLFELNTYSTMVSIGGSHSDYAAASVFGRLTYAYDSRYLAEVNLRYDGSSRFSRRSRWGLFPSVSAGWRISEEPWMKNSKVDNLKIRASWGKLGNNSIGNYDYVSTYTTGILYPIGSTMATGMVSTLSNDLLEWETTTSYDVGLDLGVLNNRLTFEGDIYSKLTDGILYKAPVYATIGSKSAPYQNLCEVVNKGFEVTLGWKDDIGDFHYGISANFTRNWNQVTKYKGRLETGWVTGEDGRRQYMTNIGDVSTGSVQKVLEGKIINEWCLAPVYSGDGTHFFEDGSVNPAGGPVDGMIRTEEDMRWLDAMIACGAEFLPSKTTAKNKIWYGDYIYADVNGDGVYGSADDYKFMNKSLTPKFYYGFQVDLGWKGIDFSVLFSGAGGNATYWRMGGYNSYGTRADLTLPYDIAYDHYFYDPANPDDPRTNLTSKHGRLTLNYGSEQSGSSVSSTHFFYNLDYLRLKNLTLGYTFPDKWMRKIAVKNLRVYFSGENLFTFTSYPGMDPEYNSTTNYYAMLRQYTFGLSLKF